MAKIKEYSFSVNNVYEPVEYDDFHALAILCIRLFLLDPGTLQNNPECGIGMLTKWARISEDDLLEFNRTASEQLTNYIGNNINPINCIAYFDKEYIGRLIIQITIPGIDNMIYLSYNKETQLMQIANS